MPPSAPSLRYLLDEDVHPEAAAVARGLGLDVESVHDLNRRGLTDAEQLRRAAADGRVFVTRNRDDYIALTVEAFRAGEPHAGVLILPHTLPNKHSAGIARAIAAWDARRRPGEAVAYTIDFVSKET